MIKGHEELQADPHLGRNEEALLSPGGVGSGARKKSKHSLPRRCSLGQNEGVSLCQQALILHLTLLGRKISTVCLRKVTRLRLSQGKTAQAKDSIWRPESKTQTGNLRND